MNNEALILARISESFAVIEQIYSDLQLQMQVTNSLKEAAPNYIINRTKEVLRLKRELDEIYKSSCASSPLIDDMERASNLGKFRESQTETL